MKRDMDLVRALLIKIADAHEPAMLNELVSPESVDYDRVAYHMRMLVNQAGFVSGKDVSTEDGDDWMFLELTWAGNDFLESIRDPDVWAKVKEGAQKVGGAGWDMITAMSKAYAKAKLKELTGLDL